MARIQSAFESFHDAIRIDYDISATLREKRDILVSKIRNHLRKHDRPGVAELLQGSYRMKTGVKPIGDLDLDIDVGLRFGINHKEVDAKTARSWVYDAIKDHTNSVDNRPACIRVKYAGQDYHVDLVTYAVETDEHDSDVFHLSHSEDGWRPADPPGLLAHVDRYRSRFEGTEDKATRTDQFRRCVRYLRRWSDVRIPTDEAHKPTGLAFVLLAIRYGLAKAVFLDDTPDDLSALHALTTTLSSNPSRLVATKPTPEYDDVLARLNGDHMTILKNDLRRLSVALATAAATADPVVACEALVPHFGTDFPIPKKSDTAARTSAPAIIASQRSA